MSTSKPSKRGSSQRAYHHGNLREALVEAGLAFLEKEQHGDFSLRELSRKVGVSANAGYRHFADKEALLIALAAEGFRRLLAEQSKAGSAENNPMARHRASGKAYVRFARTNPALFRLMFGRPSSKGQSVELKAASELAFEALRSGSARSLNLSADDERVTAAAIRAWSLVHGLSQLILAGHLDEFEADLDSVIDSVLRPPPSAPTEPKSKLKKK